MRRAGLHFGEALVGRDGVDLDPALPRLFLISGGLKRGQAEWKGRGTTSTYGRKTTTSSSQGLHQDLRILQGLQRPQKTTQ